MPVLPFQLTCTSKTTGATRVLRYNEHFTGWNASLERSGGMQDFTLALAAGSSEMTDITFGDTVEASYAGVLRYRGTVEQIERGSTDQRPLTVSGYGIAFRAGQREVDGQYLYGDPTDVSIAWRDAVADVVANDEFTDVVIEALPVGALVEQVEATRKPFGQVAQEIVEGIAENKAVWGGDVVTDADDPAFGSDRLFFRPIETAITHSLSLPGARTGASTAKRSAGDVKNQVRINGGPPRFPQLFGNSSFERLVFSGETSGGLLPNGDFEQNSVPDDADLSGGASLKNGGGAEGNPYSGSKMLELDGSGEEAEWTVNPAGVIVGADHTVTCRARLETIAASTAAAAIEFQWIGAGDTPIGSLETVPIPAYGSAEAVKLSAYWTKFSGVFRCPVGATGFIYRLAWTAGGGGSGQGILFDACNVFNNGALVADGWELFPHGSAEVNRADWNGETGTAWDGRRFLFCDVTASDSDGQDIHLRRTSEARINVVGGQALTLSAAVQEVPGEAHPKVLLDIYYYKADGSAVGSPTRTAFAAALDWSDWTVISTSVTIPQTCTQVHAYLNLRGSGQLRVDAMGLQDSQADADAYQRDGNYTVRIDCDDPALTGLSDAVTESQSQYGVRYAAVTVDSVTTLAEARRFAEAYFAGNAVPFTSPPVVRYDDAAVYVPGQRAALTGPDGADLMGGLASLPIVRNRMSFEGGRFVQVIELQNERPDPVEELIKRLKKQQGVVGVGSAGAYTAAAAGQSSGSVGVTLPLGKSLVTAADTTANYLGAKLVAGTNITLTVLNPGADETYSIAAAGGLTNPMTTLGDVIYGGSSPAGTPTRLAGNTTTTRKFLRQTGNGTISAAPDWDTLLAADIPALTASGISDFSEAVDDRVAALLSASLGVSAVYNDAGNVIALASVPVVVALTDASTIAVDAALFGTSGTGRVSSAVNRTLGTPSNPTDGQRISIEWTNTDGSARTLSLSSGYAFGGDITALTATTAGKTDYLGFAYHAPSGKWRLVAYNKGF